jgi:DtxR family Mn-dependent transcriptional regulator
VVSDHFEEYLGAIFRLRQDAETALPLSQLQLYFGYSPISIHEMVQKLTAQGLVAYQPYHGVILTADGEGIGRDLVRRHRLWERFLTDLLGFPADSVHDIAGQLEHAAPQEVTERLARLLGNPESCPHGDPIPPRRENLS